MFHRLYCLYLQAKLPCRVERYLLSINRQLTALRPLRLSLIRINHKPTGIPGIRTVNHFIGSKIQLFSPSLRSSENKYCLKVRSCTANKVAIQHLFFREINNKHRFEMPLLLQILDPGQKENLCYLTLMLFILCNFYSVTHMIVLKLRTHIPVALNFDAFHSKPVNFHNL